MHVVYSYARPCRGVVSLALRLYTVERVGCDLGTRPDVIGLVPN